MAGLTYRLYIDGQWVDAEGSEVLTVVNPATEEAIGAVPQASSKDVLRAIQAARTAFDEGPWPKMRPAERAAILLKMGEIMTRRKGEIVDLVVREAGATQMLADFLQVSIPLGHFIDLADRVIPSFPYETPMLPSGGPGLGLGQGVVTREPVGVAALITPFNFPFFLNIMKLGPALGSGCTVVLKPSPYTPLEAFILGEIADEAGLPPGVLNIVTGDVAAGQELTTNPMVDMVSFTGSDVVGRQVMSQAAGTLKKVVLELGGKSANVVFGDANLDKVVPDVLMGFTLHCGQGCSLLTRTLVEESIHDELVARVTGALPHVKVGNPADPEVALGPLIREVQRERVESFIRSGVEEGAQIAYGGQRPAHLEKGYFLEPTLFTGVRNTMTIAQREIFGPVGVIIPFRTEEEAIALANESEYGLGGGVWSADPVRAYGVARQLRTGMVIVNGGGGGLSPHGPFGGWKASGLGREFGEYGLGEYLEHKTIVWGVAAG